MPIKQSLIAILAISSLNAIDNLGTINITSSTIDDKFAENHPIVSNIVTLNENDIKQQNTQNIANILNTVPGLTVRENEGDSNKIHIRGIATELYMGEKPGVAIVIDGVPVQERAGSVNIDTDNIKSIKIIKGGASYLYGNDAIGGAIIITTKRPKNLNEGLVSIERGSEGYKKYLASFNGNTENFAVNLQASDKRSDGYWQDSDYWAKSLNGKIQYYINDTSDITLGIDHSTRYENDTGSITAKDVNGVSQIKNNPESKGEVGYATQYDIELDKYFLTYSNDINDNTNLITQLYKYTDITKNVSSPYDTNSDGLDDDHLYDAYAKTQQEGFKTEFRQTYQDIAYMIGLDLARNEEEKSSQYRVNYTGGYPATTHLIGEEVSDTTSKERINALYGEIKYAITDKLTTTFNSRIDEISYDYKNNLTSSNWNKDFTETSYRIGSAYKTNDSSIFYANASTGFRVPTLSQIYAGDTSTSTYNGTYSNNTDIKTEKTYNYELGFKSKTDFLSFDLAIFQINRDDVIGASSGNYASTRGVEVKYDNMADIENKGLELSLSTDKQQEIYFVFNYTYLNSKYTRYDEYNLILNEAGVDHNGNNFDGNDENYVSSTHNLSGKTVPRTSKHTLNLSVNYKIVDNLLLTAQYNYRSSQFADDLNKIKIAGYSVVDLQATYNTKISTFPLELFVKAKNVLNKQYYMMPRVTGDRNDDGVYDKGDIGLTVNPGRTYLAGLTLKF